MLGELKLDRIDQKIKK